jgi:hypothetical protein
LVIEWILSIEYLDVFHIIIFMSKNIANSQSGYAALITVVIIGAAALIIAKNVSLLNLGELDMAVMADKGDEALVIADGCVEETIRRFTLDPNYSANDYELELGNGNCVINTSDDGDARTITVVSRVGDYYQEINAEITLSDGGIILNSWQEQ